MSTPSTEIPPFQPCIEQSQLGPHYTDGRVHGDVDWDPDTKALAIYTWSSDHQGQGHTQQALAWMRNVLGAMHIHVVGAGYVEDGIPNDSLRYWLHLGKHGWIDSIEDDEGLDVLFETTPGLANGTNAPEGP